MTKILASSQVEQFRRDGYLHPVRVISEDDAGELLARLEAYEAAAGGPLRGDQRQKPHLLFSWMAELVTNERVVDAVEDLFGPNLLCWSTTLFVKEPHDRAYVSWHQDATYWGLTKSDVVTAWVALSPSTRDNGALEVLPGTHHLDQLPHVDTFAADNLLSRGQEIAVDLDAAGAVTLELRPGEMSLHHVKLVHGSAPNSSGVRRVGLAIRYLPTDVAPVAGSRDSATLVRGVDELGRFEHEPLPTRDFDPAFVELHRRITGRQAEILLAGTGLQRFDDVPS